MFVYTLFIKSLVFGSPNFRRFFLTKNFEFAFVRIQNIVPELSSLIYIHIFLQVPLIRIWYVGLFPRYSSKQTASVQCSSDYTIIYGFNRCLCYTFWYLNWNWIYYCSLFSVSKALWSTGTRQLSTVWCLLYLLIIFFYCAMVSSNNFYDFAKGFTFFMQF